MNENYTMECCHVPNNFKNGEREIDNFLKAIYSKSN